MSGDFSFAPILVFVYNRIEHTRKTLSALLSNTLAAFSDLIIYSDGPKNEKAIEEVEKVREFINTIIGFRSVRIVNRPENYGLARSIISGVTDTLKQSDVVIVLEDDMITSKYFLQYMNDALSMYKLNNDVISIHGYVYPVTTNLPDTFFLRGADCWGWATWKRGWNIFEKDGEKLLTQLKERQLIYEFDFNDTYPFSQMLVNQINSINNSWAIRWYASAFLKNKLTLYPGKSFVKNIGLDGSGTHSSSNSNYDVDLVENYCSLEKIEVVENLHARKSFEKYFLTINSKVAENICVKFKKNLKTLFKYILPTIIIKLFKRYL